VKTLPLFDMKENGNDALAVEVSRAQSLYGVHAYHTKVPPEAIEPYLLRHTNVGDLVLDPFCGSGMTGVAARRHGRRAWLSDLSPAAVHIASNYTLACDSTRFSVTAECVTTACEPLEHYLYGTHCDRCGGSATIAYVIWSDIRSCPSCEAEIRIWDHREQNLRRITCIACRTTFAKSQARVTAEVPVRVNIRCSACGRVERDPLPEDVAATQRSRAAIPWWYPEVPFGRDREMWRKGHDDLSIRSAADFYSVRNLWALSGLWETINAESDDRLRSALRFAFTAIANRASRRYQWNAKRPTNVLGGTLYVSSLRYEFNVFDLWRRKVNAARKLFAATWHDSGAATVIQSSATSLPLPDVSVDYCFTDPPFGANIVYSDSSLLWEAWLDDLTDTEHEAIVNRHRKLADGGKDVATYGDVMTQCFGEIARVLRPSGSATVVFQNTDPVVWDAVQAAIEEAGFRIEHATTLHKQQPSFKGVKAHQEGERVAATDVVLSLARRGSPRSRSSPEETSEVVWNVVRAELQRIRDPLSRKRSSGHLYAVAVAAAVAQGLPAHAITFDDVEKWLRKNDTTDHGPSPEEASGAAR
jgi:DNA modification methylase